MTVAPWVKRFTEDVIGSAPFAVGDIVNHPKHGRVLIIGGQFWGEHGLSNFWTWKKVDAFDQPYGEACSGYGW